MYDSIDFSVVKVANFMRGGDDIFMLVFDLTVAEVAGFSGVCEVWYVCLCLP